VITGDTARFVAAGVFIVVDVAIIALWLSVMRTSPELTRLLVASIVTLAVGACCLVAVIVLGRRWRRPVAPRRPNRSTAAGVLSAVSVLQLVGGFTALLVLGAFATANGITVLGATMIEAVVVAALGVNVGRYVARTAAGVHG
jgi:hypothetical protein